MKTKNLFIRLMDMAKTKRIMLAFVLVFSCLISVYGQGTPPPPPPPGSNGLEGDVPTGGNAPIDDGLLLLIGLSVVYFSVKLYNLKNSNDPAIES